MKDWKLTKVALVILALVVCAVPAMAWQSFSDSEAGGDAVAVTVGPGLRQTFVKFLQGTSDQAGQSLEIHVRDGAPDTTTEAAASTVLTVTTDDYVGASDEIVIVRPDGQTHFHTIASVADKAITLDAAVDPAAPAGTRVFKMQKVAELPVGAATKTWSGEAVWVTPSASPLHLKLDGNAAAVSVMVTVDN